jgi:hypothetical protein
VDDRPLPGEQLPRDILTASPDTMDRLETEFSGIPFL